MADKPRILILSGGIDAQHNYLSQYLYALDFTKQLRFLGDVTTIFGSGISPDNEDVMPPDVSETRLDGKVEFQKGVIEGNKPATEQNVDAFFKGDKKVSTYLLIVGGHGSLDSVNESCINLWSPTQCLSVSALKKIIKDRVSPETPIYHVQSQCFSGGFHALGYSIGADGIPYKDGNICGFTSTTKNETASGCASNPFDTSGYESLIVRNVATSKTLSEAHDKVMVSDETKDVPLRTSEAFILDYLKARPIDLEKLDEKYKQLTLSSKIDDPILNADLQRRLKVIGDLLNRFKEIATSNNLSGIIKQRKLVQEKFKGFDEDRVSLRKQYEELFQPIRKKYFASHKKGNDVDVIVWARKSSKFNLKNLDKLQAKLIEINRLANEAERHAGILQRIEIQMTIAAAVVILFDENKTKIVNDFKGFVRCETAATVHSQQ